MDLFHSKRSVPTFGQVRLLAAKVQLSVTETYSMLHSWSPDPVAVSTSLATIQTALLVLCIFGCLDDLHVHAEGSPSVDWQESPTYFLSVECHSELKAQLQPNSIS